MDDFEVQKMIDDIIVDESGILSDDAQDSDYTPNAKRSTRKRNQNRVKITHTWSHEDIVQLITEVETRPAIWNVGHTDYKNRNKRDSAWQEISCLFAEKIPVEELTSKWQCLRTQYRSANASAKKTESGQAVSSKPHWKYYSQMDFVGAAEQSQTVQSVSNLDVEDIDDSVTALSGSSSVGSSSNSGVAFRKRKADQTTVKIDEFKEKDDVLIAGMKCAMDRLQQKKTPDDTQAFGTFLVSELRKIRSPSYRLSTQRQLLQLLWERIDKEPVTIENLDVVFVNQIDGTIPPAA